MNYLLVQLVRFKLWVAGLAAVAAGVWYAYTQIQQNAVEDFVHDANEKALKDLRERNQIEKTVDDLDVDATVERLRKEGWLRK